MPVTSVNLDDGVVLSEYKVRTPRQRAVMQSEAQALSVEKTADNSFRLCVLSLDSGHHPASGGAVYNIRH